ncbi:MAG: hypothetical protein ACI9A7_000658 [Cyclobacteriaceae bacterium]|jgi:hypothetical protein
MSSIQYLVKSFYLLIKRISLPLSFQKNHAIIAFLLTWTVACTSSYEEINTNPNAPIEVQPALLLRQVIYNYGEEMSYEGFVAGNLLSQHFTMVDFNLFDRHDLSSPQLGGNPWPVIYGNLRDNELILEMARSTPVNAVYEGPALILKAFFAASLTDIYGDVPYFEALKGSDGNTTPIYDSQESIYVNENGILDNLNKGIEAISSYNGVQFLEGDILFDGNLRQWIRFANSLKIKYWMRISDKINVSHELQAIFQNQDYINSSDDNAVFDFTDNPPNSFRMSMLRSGDFNLFVMSKTMENILTQLNDNRKTVLFRPNEQGDYFGLNNGPDAANTSISITDYSLTGTVFRESTGLLDANFMTSWETIFLLAEAAAKGLISADPKILYEKAVVDAFEYWSADMFTDYLAIGSASYNQENGIAQIITQKWIANSINGYENWIEYRRTGLPILNQVESSLNNGLIPVRMPYPPEEAALNGVNYHLATVKNNNSINAKVWWDVD